MGVEDVETVLLLLRLLLLREAIDAVLNSSYDVVGFENTPGRSEEGASEDVAQFGPGSVNSSVCNLRASDVARVCTHGSSSHL